MTQPRHFSSHFSRPLSRPFSRLAARSLLAGAAAALLLLVAGPARAADKHSHAHDHQPLHGGVVVEVKDVDHELVATPTRLQLHLRDHGKPMDLSQASAKLTLLSGKDKQDVQLQPAGAALQATGQFQVGPGTKVVAVVNLPGKPASTARFVLK